MSLANKIVNYLSTKKWKELWKNIAFTSIRGRDKAKKNNANKLELLTGQSYNDNGSN